MTRVQACNKSYLNTSDISWRILFSSLFADFLLDSLKTVELGTQFAARGDSCYSFSSQLSISNCHLSSTSLVATSLITRTSLFNFFLAKRAKGKRVSALTLYAREETTNTRRAVGEGQGIWRAWNRLTPAGSFHTSFHVYKGLWNCKLDARG